jgi:hypothetical protein
MILKRFILIPSFFSVCFFNLNAQDDLLSMVADSTIKPKREKVYAMFKTTKIVNLQSIESVKRGELDFRVTHRFGDMAVKGGEHSLWGFDQSADIRLSFDYGIRDNFAIGIGRSKYLETVDFSTKYRAIEQTVDKKIPVTISLYGNAAINAQSTPTFYAGTNWNKPEKFAHRISYFSQLIVARKFSKIFSAEVLASYLHRNFVKGAFNSKNSSNETNGLFSIGLAGRLKITKRMCILADYVYTVSKFRQDNSETPFYNPLGLGLEIETGGHVFHITWTNSAPILENNLVPYSNSSWSDGQFKLGFNISRAFVVHRVKE